MTVVSTLPNSDEANRDRAIIFTIFSSIGRCTFLDEKHFDACTALSGSGPAFVCVFLEAMVDGGVMMGLPRAEALELAAQSMFLQNEKKSSRSISFRKGLQGAARMALQPGAHPAQIKDAVTSTSFCYPSHFTQLSHFCPSSWRLYHCWTIDIGRW